MGDAGFTQGQWNTIEMKQFPDPDGGGDPRYSISYNGVEVYAVNNWSAQVKTNMNLSLGDPYYSDANSRIKNLIVAEAFADTDFHYAQLEANLGYIDAKADDPVTTICCGETPKQGCGDNTLAYDKRDDTEKNAWEAQLTAGNVECDDLDTATGKPHVWKTLYPR